MIGNLLELPDREAGPAPQREDFPTLREYLDAWHYWRAVRRDAWLTPAESDAAFGATMWKLGYPEDFRP